jgi:hypothetical protein
VSPRDRIGRRDHFFDLGGTSLTELKLAITLDRAVCFDDLTGHPILADLAALIDGRSDNDPGGFAPRTPDALTRGDPWIPVSASAKAPARPRRSALHSFRAKAGRSRRLTRFARSHS